MQLRSIAFVTALCAFFTVQTEARTLYVDASRPNNKGNGLKLKTAKKTIQAAINIAKKGDTILVYPGDYAPITTKNKKIKIKSRSGAGKTDILYKGSGKAIAKLGAAWQVKYEGYWTTQGTGDWHWVPAGSRSSDPETKGTITFVSGFTLDGNGHYPDVAVSGGTLQSCVVRGSGYNGTVHGSKMTNCTIKDNNYLDIQGATLNKCKLQNNSGSSYDKSESSEFINCLFACNETTPFNSCTFVNSTVADNTKFTMAKSKAYNTIFYKVAASQFKKSKKNTLQNCYKGSNPKFKSLKSSKKKWVADEYGNEERLIGATVWWRRLTGGYVEWEIYNDEIGWDYGSVSVSGTTDAAILAAAKAAVGKEDALYVINDYVYDEGSVSVSGTTDAAILAAAKAKVGQVDAKYEIDRYDYQWGFYDTSVIPGDYRLAKGSPCINKGKLTKAQKKLVGSKDLAGKKRIKGKIDIGCYEY